MRRFFAFGAALALLLPGAPYEAPQKAGVPAYWTLGAGFDRLAASAPTVDTAIVNGPADGPPRPFDPATAAAIGKLAAAGISVLGYVDTGYLGRTGLVTTRVNPGSTEIADWQAQAAQDAADWFSLYGGSGLAGIFFDQALSTCGPGDQYVKVYGHLSDESEGLTVLNQGTDTEECYTRVADAIVIFENTYQAYLGWTPPAWVARYPARMFWHLVHAVPKPAGMRQVVALSKRRNAGHIYVTDDTIDATGTPWDRLPPDDYWEDELRQISPAPSF